MASLSLNAATVVADADGLKTVDGIAGGTITQGMFCWLNPNGQWVAYDADNVHNSTDQFGIALCASSLNQSVRLMQGGTYVVGATVAAGAVYVAGITTAGDIVLVSDAAAPTTGDYLVIIGVGISTTKMRVGIVASGVAKA